MNRVSKIINSKWTVTLVSTMLGIIVGLYISNYFEKNQLLNAKKIALEQVSIELLDNKILLETYHQKLKEKYQALTKVLGILNENMDLITHVDSLDNFKNKTKSIFKFSNFEPIKGDQIKIRGDLDLNITSELIARNLSHIVWDSYKQTNYMSVTTFDCLTEVETIYSLQNEVNILNNKWKDVFFRGAFMTNLATMTDFMNLWEQLIMRQKLLLGINEFQDDIMKKCN